jgi:hypothetical protein
LCGSAPLKKAVTNPAKDDLINVLQLFIKRGWMNDPDYAAEKVTNLSFNELKRLVTSKGAVHKFFRDHKIDVSFTPPGQFNFDSVLAGAKLGDTDEEEEVVDVTSDVLEDEDTKTEQESPVIVEGVQGTSADLDPAKSMAIDPDHVVQLTETKQRATIIPKLRRYLMNIAPNHFKARGEHLNSVPTEKLLSMLRPIPLLEYLKETGTFKEQVQQAQLPAKVFTGQSEELVINSDDSMLGEEKEHYVSRNYLRSRTAKGEPGVREAPSVALLGMLQVVSALIKENGQTLHLLPFDKSSGAGPLDLNSDMGLVTAKQLAPYLGKVLAENPAGSGYVQVTEQQVRDGVTWKQVQFKLSGTMKSLFPLSAAKTGNSIMPLREWLHDKRLTTGTHEAWPVNVTEKELWILCELDEFVDPIEVKAELTQRTGLSNSHFKVQHGTARAGQNEYKGLCIFGNISAEDEINYKMNRFNKVSAAEAPLTHNIYPVRASLTHLETGGDTVRTSRLDAHLKYLNTRIVAKFTGIPATTSPHTIPSDTLSIVKTPVGTSNTLTISQLALMITRPGSTNRASPIKRVVKGEEPGEWIVIGVEEDSVDMKQVCLVLLSKLQQWSKSDGIRVDFSGMVSARQEEMERKRAEASTPSKLPFTPTSQLSSQLDSTLAICSSEKTPIGTEATQNLRQR